MHTQLGMVECLATPVLGRWRQRTWNWLASQSSLASEIQQEAAAKEVDGIARRTFGVVFWCTHTHLPHTPLYLHTPTLTH